MKYGELVQNIRDLGFSDDSEIEEFETDVNVISNSINRAITEISLNYAPIYGHYDINPLVVATDEVTGDVADIIEVNMSEAVDGFMKLADIPVKRELAEGVYKRYGDYEVEENHTIILDGSYDGNLRIFYVKAHTPCTELVIQEDSEEYDTELPLPLKAHHLVPLLASYYVWLDDDMTKANAYYEKYQYVLEKAQQEAEKPKGRVITGWGEI